MRCCLAIVAVVIVSNPVAFSADRPEGRAFATRSVTYARNGLVSAAHPLAVQVGIDMLKAGGSAVDAAIAVNAALGFLEPTANGLGGDLFAIVWDPKTEKLYGLNASGRAPASLTIDKVPPEEDGTVPVYSVYSWTVPGCADGWFELHEKFGNLPMEDVLRPAAEGEVFANPALAHTLDRLAVGGRDAFYRGEIAEQIVAFSDEVGGFFSRQDFANHTTEWVEPISTTYRGVTVWELPPNPQGLAALQMLNILEGFDLAAMGRDSTDFWHVMVEAKKLAYEDRARYYADMQFAEVPVDALLDKEYATERAKLIDMKRAARTLEPGNPALDHGDTTFLATADGSGMLVSLIQSNYTGFESGYVVPNVGIGIQDRGALFSLDPAHPNALEPGKRPFHTIIPAFMGWTGVPDTAFGLMGGAMQPQGHVQIVVNLVDFGMNLQEAGDAPRFNHGGSSQPTGTVMTSGGILRIEKGLPPEVYRDLAKRGHRIQETNPVVFGGYQIVHRDPETGVLSGATESRKDGMAAGY
ncbi:MAG: gamma-glutamyltransferase family protein [Acidobacteriota bacterium]